ncbi:hypothetical protein RDWZM_003643 [Blomia tropicalis]|uniref:Uncharacterized protein n=1 Tax=Blomia tropicalis TaxID=40697 RepID=A0A9Q0RR26_BLOTA|nr:hypothetical protein BLOT_002781 [Blomia tropicalis]KAJ6225098.1 hypothetical protein RDWZM_003643 [Blomia tropicalis]
MAKPVLYNTKTNWIRATRRMSSSNGSFGTLFGQQMAVGAIMILVILIGQQFHLAYGFDLFDIDCPDNGMRKPPRFGKRSQQINEQNDESNAGESIPELEIGQLTRNRRSGCFRGPIRRRMMRDSSVTSSPPLITSRDTLMDSKVPAFILNSPLFKRLFRQRSDEQLRQQMVMKTEQQSPEMLTTSIETGLSRSSFPIDHSNYQSSNSKLNPIIVIELDTQKPMFPSRQFRTIVN